MLLGYCTNVHAGPTLEQTRANLEVHALDVKQRFSPHAPMGVGLWIAAPAAEALTSDERALAEFRDWLESVSLIPYTFNGFPYGDFHLRVVKHRVYVPTWDDPDRRDYTLRLAQIQHALLPAGMSGTISTLPVAWGEPALPAERVERAAKHLIEVARFLEELDSSDGRRIQLCIEPEPGCFLQRTTDVVEFFHRSLYSHADGVGVSRYVGVCHDVCHAAVMFEDQRESLARFDESGIDVAKVQVSSAVELSSQPADGSLDAAFDQLSRFAEDRYLHQTCLRRSDGTIEFHEDLPRFLDERRAALVADPPSWDRLRVHFHVPIYLERFGELSTTRFAIEECLGGMTESFPGTETFEAETYAWGVLPPELQHSPLAAGIAAELAWLERTLATRKR